MAEIHSLQRHAGAAAVPALLKRLKDLSDKSLGAAWAAHPELEGEDCRDYPALAQVVLCDLEANLRNPDLERRSGYLAALTDLLCIVADGCEPGDGWRPLANARQGRRT